MRRVGARLGLALVGVALALGAGWGALAIWYRGPQDGAMRGALAAAFALAGLAAALAISTRRWRARALSAYAAAFAALLAWWFVGVAPSNDRDWQPEVARVATIEIEGDAVTVRNVRDFDYRSETDFTPAWRERRFDLRKLDGVDLVASYWMGPAIAHTFLSFGFEGGDRLAISIETRKEKGEGYSTVAGFFREYELYYVVADERDVIRVRTNYRADPPEDVYVYPIAGSREDARRVFLEYARQVNSLATRPEFYNTLTSNCTTDIWANTRANVDHLPFSWKILASGYVPQYLYETGRLDTSVPFDELRRRAHVNARARAADAAPDFSRRIREHLQ